MRYLLLLAFFTFSHFCTRAQTLVPNWVDDLGGATGTANTTGVAVDKQNNVYITGYFSGTVDFDPSAGVKNLTSAGGGQYFCGEIYIGRYIDMGRIYGR